MTQEDIISMRDKNCPDWLCDPPTEEYLLKKIAKLEAGIKHLKNTSANSDYAKCKIEAEIKRLENNPEGDYITRISALEWALRIIAER